MTLRFYCDEDSMARAVVSALRARGIDVTTVFEAGMVNRTDTENLEYAMRQGRVILSFNRQDFFRLHTEYLAQGKSHAGIILANQQQYSIGEVMRRILRLSAARTPKEMENRIEFLTSWG